MSPTLRLLLAAAVAVSVVSAAPVGFTQEFGWNFQRGDVNDDAVVNLADVVTLLGQLFNSAPAPCRDAQDVDDDGIVAINDAILIASYLFSSGAPPEPPFPNCGLDPTADDLACFGALLTCPPAAGGSAMFTIGATFPLGLGAWPWTLEIADLDDDGDPDALAIGESGITGGAAVAVMLNEGGTFTTQLYGTGPNSDPAQGLGIGDLDNDGHLDLAIGLAFEDEIRLFFGNGDGTFVPAPTPLTYWRSIQDVDFVDLDEDGALDIVASTGIPGDSVLYHEWWMGNGDGSFGPREELLVVDVLGSSSFGWTEFVDLDDDGHVDAVSGLSVSNALDYVVWRRGVGFGWFEPPASAPISGGLYDGQIERFGSGPPKFVASTQDETLRVFGVIDGSLTEHAIVPFPGFLQAFTLGDVNGDGTPDVVGGGVFADTLRVGLIGDPLWIVSNGTYTVDSPARSAVADFDGDGDNDILNLSNTNAVTVLWNQIVP